MIEKYLDKAEKPCVFFSGGIDSLLVLSQVREIKPDIPVVTFRQDMPDHQWKIIENVIKKWDLQVLSWPPANAYFLPNGEGTSYVTEYSLNGFLIPLVRDIIPNNNKCSLEFSQTRLEVMPFAHDVVFVGTRKADSHNAMGKPISKPVTTIGPITFVAPIFEWTKDEVTEAAKDLPFSEEFYTNGDEAYDTGNLPACSNCLNDSGKSYVFCPKKMAYIPKVDWDRPAMLSAFQKKFQFEVNN